MPNLGYATTQEGHFKNTTLIVPADESVCGMLFDISGFDNPFDDYLDIYYSFGSGQVVQINSLNDAIELGLGDNNFLNGLVYYHISMFYDYVGDNRPLYLTFADCSSDWDAIGLMQRESGGRIFQVGIWTYQQMWSVRNDNSIEFTNLITQIETSVEELTGKIGQSSFSPTPLSVVLSANTSVVSNIEKVLKKLPDATVLEAPKVSILLCQNGSDYIKSKQSLNPQDAPFSSMGFALAALSLADAEKCIGAVSDFNLNKNEQFRYPEIPIGDGYSIDDEVNRVVLNTIATLGYIVPVIYDGKDGECFFNSDTTLSRGDYKTIANNRVIHKCRRSVYTAIYPYINSDHIYESGQRGISSSSIQEISNAIGDILSGNLINKGGEYQISGYNIDIFSSDDILNDGVVFVKYSVVPVNYNDVLTDTITSE